MKRIKVTRRNRLLVKVQLSLVTSAAERQVLVYNQDRSVMGQFSLTDELERQLGGRLKSFWFAHSVPDRTVPGGYVIVLDRPAPEQEW